MSESKGCSVDVERSLREVCELTHAILGFVVAESISRKFIDGLCDILFKEHGMELPANSDRYLSECLALSLKNKETRELFYWIGILYHYILVLAPVLEDNPIEHEPTP